MTGVLQSVELGFWLWAGVTIILSVACLGVLLWAAFYKDRTGEFRDETPQLVFGLYFVLKECGALIGGIVGLSALAWAHFFQAVR
ncbi:MAG TPA: hypothetical protein VFV07_08490 [Rhizomicrobium sp.]|nr:hypothetical protein [Rhizomicrobium sp.]